MSTPVPYELREERFRQFHHDHPEVYREMVARTRREIAEGRRPRVRRIWEEVRSELRLPMNDHLHSFYARLVMEREPDLRGAFRTRARKAA